ncbi:hypothetical protein ACHIPZ_13805 [Antrihabitans sp. NCIMB 15449]|uniref:Uncharacterized protein n=1 Tax=Antrihabitans spumae TaxID=3373370 RepID=A0ABW7JMN2_9NOCA
MTNAPQMVAACVGFLDDAIDGVLSHTNQPALTDAVADAAKRTLPGGDWAWDRAADGVISPLVAATLARWGLLTFGSVAAGPAPKPDFDEIHDSTDQFDALAVGF